MKLRYYRSFLCLDSVIVSHFERFPLLWVAFFSWRPLKKNLFSISRTIGSIFLCVSGENFDTSSSKASFKATSISAQTSVLLHFAVSEYHLYASCNCCGSSTSTTCFTSQVVSGVLATNSTAPLKPCSCCDLICGTVVLPQVFALKLIWKSLLLYLSFGFVERYSAIKPF